MFFAGFAVGKWTQETCRRMFEGLKPKLKKPTRQRKLRIFSDGNDDYTFVIPQFFDVKKVEYGQLIKVRENGKIVKKEKRIIFGKPDAEKIETTSVECFNSVIRERLGSFVRRTKCFAKKKMHLENSLRLFQFYWNFMKPLDGGLTPAVMEKQCDRIWTWDEFLYKRLSDIN